MPFTPLHLGPGLLVKACLRNRFSVVVFGWSQILIDIQPLLALTTGVVALHGISHTYLGAIFIALLTAVTAGPAIRLGTWTGVIPRQFTRPINRRVVLASALIGTLSHVALDSIMHIDVTPWLPLSAHNGLHGVISLSALHLVCLATGIAGLIMIALFRLLRPQQS